MIVTTVVAGVCVLTSIGVYKYVKYAYGQIKRLSDSVTERALRLAIRCMPPIAITTADNIAYLELRSRFYKRYEFIESELDKQVTLFISRCVVAAIKSDVYDPVVILNATAKEVMRKFQIDAYPIKTITDKMELVVKTDIRNYSYYKFHSNKLLF